MIEAFILIVIHFISDFIFQDEKWALGKSKSWKPLVKHTLMYSLVFGVLVGINPILQITNWWLILFTLIIFICHTIIDFFTSKIISRKFAMNQLGSTIPNFGAFTIIGFDQVLHYFTIFLTYMIISIIQC